MGTSEELVDVGSYQRLKTVEPLRVGESKAEDNPPVEPVDLDIVRKTIPQLPPIRMIHPGLPKALLTI